MLASILALPVLGLVLMLQTAVSSRLPLLYGTTDLVLLILIAWSLQERVRSAWFWAASAGLFMAFVSALPPLVSVIGYFSVTAAARSLHRRIWKTPVLAMFTLTALGTLLMHGLSIAGLSFLGTELPLVESLELITLPSLLLNLLLSLPAYTLMKDLAGRLYPEKMEV